MNNDLINSLQLSRGELYVIESFMRAHMWLQTMYLSKSNLEERQSFMIELMTLDARFQGYVIGIGKPYLLEKYLDIVNFEIGHTHQDLLEWRNKFNGSSRNKD